MLSLEDLTRSCSTHSTKMIVFSALKRIKKLDTKNHDWPQICVIIFISLGSFSSSALFAWTSPSIPLLTSSSSYIGPITLEQSSYLPMITAFSVAVITIVIWYLMDRIGRKQLITLIPILQIIIWTLIIFAKNLITLYIARVIQGIPDSILFCTLPLYMAEIATPNIRGSWGNLIVVSLYMGQFVMNAIGGYLDIITTAWILLTFPIIQFVLMLFVPESPYYLLTKNRKAEAEECLKLLRWNENVEDELKQISEDVARQMSEGGSFSDIFTTRIHRNALFISFSMRMFQQFSGFSVFFVYTQYIFTLAGGELSASDSTVIFTGFTVIVNALAAFVVHKFGRRSLMITSCLGCAIILFVEAAYFYISFETNLNVTKFTWIPLTGMLIYTISCAMGLGILPVMMIGELFSASVKNKAVGIITSLFAISVVIVPKLYQFLTSNFSPYVPFLLFSICTAIGAVFSYYFVPETKGKTLEEIQIMLSTKKIRR